MSKTEFRDQLRCKQCNYLLGKVSARRALEKFGGIEIMCPKSDCKNMNYFGHDPNEYVKKDKRLDDELEAMPA